MEDKVAPKLYHQTMFGKVYLGDSLEVLPTHIEPESVDLIMTSPPFGLVRKKDYGNADAHEYLDWFRPFAGAFKQILKPNGSLVIDIGGAWIPGQPTRSLYHFKLMIMLCEEFGFHLAQEFYWWSPSRLPTPAEWVTVRRIRVKDAVNTVWWLSLSPYPKASNRRVLQPYSQSMEDLLKNGYKAKRRPSGHDISTKFAKNNRGSIPPNLLAIPNTDSNSYYQRYCRDNDLPVHPARYPSDLPEFFIRMLTDKDDLVVDPFAGSCVTGEVCDRLFRQWVCVEYEEDYLKGAVARFTPEAERSRDRKKSYSIWHPGAMWDELPETKLPEDGGKKRAKREIEAGQADYEVDDHTKTC